MPSSPVPARFLGLPYNHLTSRITFSLLATIHSLFVRADVIVVCYSAYSPVMTFLFRPRKTVTELFHLTGRTPLRKYGPFGLLPLLFEKLALRFSRQLVCINRAMAAEVSRQFPATPVTTIYTGFDERLLLDAPAGDDHYLLYFGRIDLHMKGIDLLLDAFERISPAFPTHRLVLAGRGSVTDTLRLRQRIAASPVAARIEFRQNVLDDEKKNLFHHATIVCMPSRFEGWCISAIEAAASCKATVGTRIMGLSESILDGRTGLLVTPEDSAALAEALGRLLQDPALRQKLGTKGRDWAARFTWEEIAREHETLYQAVAAGNNR